MNLLDLTGIPRWALGAGAAVLVLAGAAWGVHTIRESDRAAGRAEIQTKWDAAERVRKVVADKAEADRLAETNRREAADKERTNEDQRLAARARAAAASVDAAAPGLRSAFAAAVAGSGLRVKDSAATGLSPATADTGNLPAVVFGEVEQLLRGLAAAADARGDAGASCQVRYDSLAVGVDGGGR